MTDLQPPKLAADERTTLQTLLQFQRVAPDDPVQPDDTLADAIGFYRETCSRVDAIVTETESLDQLCIRDDEVGPVNLRWVLAHMLEETARHAGHADILRELIDGDTGR